MSVVHFLRNETLLYLGPRNCVGAVNGSESEEFFQRKYLSLSERPWDSLWFSELQFFAEGLLHVPSVYLFLTMETDRECYGEYSLESLDYRWKGALTDDLWKSKYYPEDRHCSMHNKSFALKTFGDALLLLALR